MACIPHPACVFQHLLPHKGQNERSVHRDRTPQLPATIPADRSSALFTIDYSPDNADKGWGSSVTRPSPLSLSPSFILSAWKLCNEMPFKHNGALPKHTPIHQDLDLQRACQNHRDSSMDYSPDMPSRSPVPWRRRQGWGRLLTAPFCYLCCGSEPLGTADTHSRLTHTQSHNPASLLSLWPPWFNCHTLIEELL